VPFLRFESAWGLGSMCVRCEGIERQDLHASAQTYNYLIPSLTTPSMLVVPVAALLTTRPWPKRMGAIANGLTPCVRNQHPPSFR
jgi:hypothetical protein